MIHLWTSRSLLRRQQQRRVALVVDGDSTFRHFALRALQRSGCVAVGLDNAEQALAWLDVNERTPALVTLDAQLAQMDGHDLCRAIRAHPRSATAPVVCASSLLTLDDHLRALRAGADAFLPKPVAPAAYIETIERLLRIGSHVQRVQSEWIDQRGM